MTIAEARRAIQISQRHLARERVDDRDYWSGKDPGESRSRASGSGTSGSGTDGSPPTVFLLQAFDELTVAYKDRSAFYDPALPRESALSGLSPNILVEGRIAGTWRRLLSGDHVSLQLRLLREIGKGHYRVLTKAVRDYGRFLGKEVSIT